MKLGSKLRQVAKGALEAVVALAVCAAAVAGGAYLERSTAAAHLVQAATVIR